MKALQTPEYHRGRGIIYSGQQSGIAYTISGILNWSPSEIKTIFKLEGDHKNLAVHFSREERVTLYPGMH